MIRFIKETTMEAFEPGALVIVHCLEPREKLWGVLLRLDRVGTVLRGLNLDAVEDWLRQEKQGDDRLINPATQFIPLHRVERLYLDETTPVSKSFGDRYAEAHGADVRDALQA
jgi:hypothetical protein